MLYVLTEPCKPEKLTTHKDMATETTITLSWKGSDPSILAYEVDYRKPGENFEKVENISNLRYTVTELNPYTKYEFKVAAINSAGVGPFTDVVTEFTSKFSITSYIYKCSVSNCQSFLTISCSPYLPKLLSTNFLLLVAPS